MALILIPGILCLCCCICLLAAAWFRTRPRKSLAEQDSVTLETKDVETQPGVAAYPARCDDMSMSVGSKAVLGVQGEINSASAEGLSSLEMLAPVDDQ